jgi:YbbR domain-containing protein
MPVLEMFTASYNSESLFVSSSGYSGNVQVTISGYNGFSVTYYTTESNLEVIDISVLESGNYTLTISSSRNVYTGVFDL